MQLGSHPNHRSVLSHQLLLRLNMPACVFYACHCHQYVFIYHLHATFQYQSKGPQNTSPLLALTGKYPGFNSFY